MGFAGGAAIEGGKFAVINMGMTVGDWMAGGVALASAGGAVAANQRAPDGRSSQPTAKSFDLAVGKMLDRVGAGIAGPRPPSMLDNLPNNGTLDTPGLGGIGAPALGAVVQGASAMNVKGDVANPVDGAYNANDARSEGKSINQLNEDIKKGKAPKSIVRADRGKPELNEKPHVHFDDGSAMNQDGSFKHGSHRLTNSEREFLRNYGFHV